MYLFNNAWLTSSLVRDSGIIFPSCSISSKWKEVWSLGENKLRRILIQPISYSCCLISWEKQERVSLHWRYVISKKPLSCLGGRGNLEDNCMPWKLKSKKEIDEKEHDSAARRETVSTKPLVNRGETSLNLRNDTWPHLTCTGFPWPPSPITKLSGFKQHKLVIL